MDITAWRIEDITYRSTRYALHLRKTFESFDIRVTYDCGRRAQVIFFEKKASLLSETKWPNLYRAVKERQRWFMETVDVLIACRCDSSSGVVTYLNTSVALWNNLVDTNGIWGSCLITIRHNEGDSILAPEVRSTKYSEMPAIQRFCIFIVHRAMLLYSVCSFINLLYLLILLIIYLEKFI